MTSVVPVQPRRFENITPGDPNEESILLFVIGGDGPKAESTDEAMDELVAVGAWLR